MKKDMVRASIYIERSVWQGIREDAHERWIPLGKYITELYEGKEISKVNKPQVVEKVTETTMPEKVEATSPTGETLPKEVYTNIETENKPAQPDKFEPHKPLGVKKKVKKAVTEKEATGWKNPLESTALAPKK